MVFFPSLIFFLKTRAKPLRPTLVYRKWGSAPSLQARCARRYSDVAGVMGWIDGWASGHNPLRSLSGAGGHHDPLRRCCFCAVMGTRQRFPLYALSFVRITGYGVSHQAHECRTLCAQMPMLAERLCEAKYSETISPGALIKDGLRPSVSAPFLRQRIYTLIRRKV